MGVHLPEPGTQVQSLVWEDCMYCRVAGPELHSYRSLNTLEPGSHRGSHCSEKPAQHTEGRPLQLEKAQAPLQSRSTAAKPGRSCKARAQQQSPGAAAKPRRSCKARAQPRRVIKILNTYFAYLFYSFSVSLLLEYGLHVFSIYCCSKFLFFEAI